MSSVTFMPSTAQLLLEVEDCYVYKFEHRVRTEIAQGPCEIFENQTNDETAQEKLYYLRVDNFFQILGKQNIIIRIKYAGTVCYLFQCQSWLCCLSFDKDAIGLEKFDINLGQSLNIVDYSSQLVDPELREKIRQACPQTIEKEDISYDMKRIVKKIGLNVGYVAGMASVIVNGPTATGAVNALSERASRFSQQNISDNAKSKWNSIKETSNTVNDALTTIVKPAVNLCRLTASKIGQAFQNSQNQVVKTIREYSYAIERSLNEGEKRGEQRLSSQRDSKLQMQNEEISTLSLR